MGPARCVDEIYVFAQAHMSIGKAYDKLSDPDAAVKHMAEGGSVHVYVLSGHDNILWS